MARRRPGSEGHEAFVRVKGRPEPTKRPVQIEKSEKIPPSRGSIWWRMNDADAAKGISSNLEYWGTNQKGRIRQLQRYGRYYSNTAKSLMDSWAEAAAAPQSQGIYFDDGQIRIGVSGSVTDTLVAKLTNHRVQPYFLTDDGDYKSQRIAKNRNVFGKGVFEENDTYALTEMAAQDACVWGDAFIYVSSVNGRVNHRRVMPVEIFVDEWEAAMYGGPRQLHLISWVDRRQLIEMYPDAEKLIVDDGFDGQENYWWLSRSLADLVMVRDSWHLPSAPGANDGIYMKTIDSGQLQPPRKWTRDHFPLARFKYGNRPQGWYGQGLIEQGMPIAQELDITAYTISENIKAVGALKIFVPTGSNVSLDQLTNQIAAIIEGTSPPIPLQWPIVQPEIYKYYIQKKAEYYELAGISQSDAASVKPAGTLSGVAMEYVHDLGTERFSTKARQFERLHRDVLNLSIWTAMEILDDAKVGLEDGKKPSYTVKYRQRGTAKMVDFAELAFTPDERWAIQNFPISTLPSDPAGRLQYVQLLQQSGKIDDATARDLMDFPDVGRVEGLHNATREHCTQTLDAMIDDGKEYELEPDDDGVMFFALAREYLQRYKRPDSGVSEKNLNIVRAFLAHLATLPENGAVQTAPEGPAAAPQAVPAPPPVSPILPNAPQGRLAA